MEDIELRGKLGRQLEELGQEAVSNRLSTEDLSVAGVRGALCVCAYCCLFSVN